MQEGVEVRSQCVDLGAAVERHCLEISGGQEHHHFFFLAGETEKCDFPLLASFVSLDKIR